MKTNLSDGQEKGKINSFRNWANISSIPQAKFKLAPFYSFFFFVNFFILPNIYISSHADCNIPDTMSKATEVL